MYSAHLAGPPSGLISSSMPRIRLIFLNNTILCYYSERIVCCPFGINEWDRHILPTFLLVQVFEQILKQIQVIDNGSLVKYTFLLIRCTFSFIFSYQKHTITSTALGLYGLNSWRCTELAILSASIVPIMIKYIFILWID